jgi:Amino acid permeases
MEEVKTKTLPIFDILRSSLLIAGTCIGGGMLALPLSIGSFGFLPSIVLIFLSCGFMTVSALLYLEATLWMKEGGHINTLSKNLLNKTWRAICLIIYVFICYASIVAYISWGGERVGSYS